jgi:hypothetical protein
MHIAWYEYKMNFHCLLVLTKGYANLTYIYAPVSKDRGHIVFGLSVCLFAKTLTLATSFEWRVIGLLYFICMLLVTRPLYWSRKF